MNLICWEFRNDAVIQDENKYMVYEKVMNFATLFSVAEVLLTSGTSASRSRTDATSIQLPICFIKFYSYLYFLINFISSFQYIQQIQPSN